MIESIEPEHIVARCAACETAREVALAALVVHTLDPSTAVVALPACACGAVEYLVRAARPEHPEPGSESRRHQLLVDHLHAELARRDQLTPGSNAAQALCVPVLPAVLAHWFPRGLCLRASEEPT